MIKNEVTQKQTSKIAVCIMPWAGLRQEVRVGPVRFWPWDKKRVPDIIVQEQLKRYFNCFVDHYGNPVNTITICSHGEPDFRTLNDIKEYNEIRSAVDILIFSIICPQTKIGVCANNQTVGPPTADRYQMIGQKMMPPNDNSIVIGAGSLTNVDQMDKIHISKPWCVGGTFGTDPDKEFISAFDKVFNTEFPADMRERIFRSLEFFRLVHTELDLGLNQPFAIEKLSKLVMMSTVFEIFLSFPDTPQKKKYFADKIQDKIANSDFIPETRTGSKNKTVTRSKAAWWAWDFYNLRNKIIHGDKIEKEDLLYKDWITHDIVADLVFWELVKRELYEHGFLGERPRKLTKKFEPVTDASSVTIEDIFARWTLGFDDVHRGLGWIPPLNLNTGVR